MRAYNRGAPKCVRLPPSRTLTTAERRHRYICDYMKAISAEVHVLLDNVRVLLNEVGALRDGDRLLQQSICPAPRRRCGLIPRAGRSWSSWRSGRVLERADAIGASRAVFCVCEKC
jgi:hypothetical protein